MKQVCEVRICKHGFNQEPATVQYFDVVTKRWFNLCWFCEPLFRHLYEHPLTDKSVPRFREVPQ